MMVLRGGFSTGSCAAAAAKAAVTLLSCKYQSQSVEITLPDGSHATFDVPEMALSAGSAYAVVIKDAGDDPDVTNGAHITATAVWHDTDEIALLAGDGIGTVTLPGLQVPPGGPAINPVPRAMIESAVREATDRGVRITISVPGGAELAKKTFNARLGIVGGLSILGTTGRVRPFSCEAMREALKCSLDITAAAGIEHPVLVPGNIGANAAATLLALKDQQVVHVGNEWGYILDAAAKHGFKRILIVGHPGKLAKLADGHWDTHSSRSPTAMGFVTQLASELLARAVAEQNTVDGLFGTFTDNEKELVAAELAERVRSAIADRLGCAPSLFCVTLVDMAGGILGSVGELKEWTRR